MGGRLVLRTSTRGEVARASFLTLKVSPAGRDGVLRAGDLFVDLFVA